MKNIRNDIMTILIEVSSMSKERMMVILNRLKTEQKAMKFLNKIKEMTIKEMNEQDLIQIATKI